MATLSKELRRALERAILDAREIAEAGSADAIVSFGVGDAKAPPHLDDPGKLLRRKLRAHGRQVGDKLAASDIQDTIHLAQECAYAHWHRMLFARFLAENDLLRHPDLGISLSLDECQDLAREQGLEVWELAGQFAQKMLPEIFRSDDPVLGIRLPAEIRDKLLKVLNEISRDVFLADDSLGWVYQFWQARKKDEVNESGKKIGADEIASVTQLFTEDYMVEFLLHNTLGAWWVAKRLNEGKIDPKIWAACLTEDECRKVVTVGKIDWKYLRFIKKDDGQWFPAAGGFEGWPKASQQLKVLDPCMGSGHFLVFALSILVAMRMEEDRFSEEKAYVAVLKDNLFGLEIDPRCAQIAAFNLALSAWKTVKYQPLPVLNLACSGLAPNVNKNAWIQLVGNNENLKFSMGRLYELFQKAPYLGSLINPIEDKSITFSSSFQDLLPYLERAVALENTEEGHELAVSAKGMAKAAEILALKFTLVATNVPYLTRQGQSDILRDHCEEFFSTSKADLATCFIERGVEFLAQDGTMSVVAPTNWLYQPAYKHFRKSMLEKKSWHGVARLGPHAFDGISGEVVNVTLVVISNNEQTGKGKNSFSVDATKGTSASGKAEIIADEAISYFDQNGQLTNPDARIVLGELDRRPLLSVQARSLTGLRTADNPQFMFCFWEVPHWGKVWVSFQSTVVDTVLYGGRSHILRWDSGSGTLGKFADLGLASIQGRDAWNKRGVTVSLMSDLPATLYSGDKYDMNCGVLWPKSEFDLPAVWAYCASKEFSMEVRKIDQQLKLTTATLLKIPFDLTYWQKVVLEKYPNGLPKPFSNDPTQWLFNGHPKNSDQPLHVSMSRLLGFSWPRQTGSSFLDCPALGVDGLENLADGNGVLCLTSLRGEPAASDRLRKLLAKAHGPEWTSQKEKQMIVATGSQANNLDDWLRDDFFTQHCIIFRHRPFLWHIWDGRKDGFHAFLNYHRLAEGGGVGRRTLESLIYSYLGDWITRQREAVKRNEAGADGRLATALELQEELEKILDGEPPYDIFVRWKPLKKQAIGWEPDINDGIRMNIRPFMKATLTKGRAGAGILRDKPNIKWDKDRGNEPSREKNDFPWFWEWDGSSKDFTGGQEFDGNRWNDCHYSNAAKRKART